VAIGEVVRRRVEWLMLGRMPVWYLMGDHCLFVSYRQCNAYRFRKSVRARLKTYEWSPG
jgi:hypothetical protein